MEKAFKLNMEQFDTKVKDMVEFINDKIKVDPRAVPGSELVDASSGKLSLVQFKNYFDHFRKPKYTENIFFTCIYHHIRLKCLN